MRIDSINLIGDFSIKGVTGQSNQAMGYTGGNIVWQTLPTPIPGTTGPQGATGPAFINNQISQNTIALGTGVESGMTSSEYYKFFHTLSTQREVLNLGMTGGILRVGTASVGIMSATSRSDTSFYSSFISTCNSQICLSPRSMIIGGVSNLVSESNNSIILGGQSNFECLSNNSSILSGTLNAIDNTSSDSVILSGRGNCISLYSYKSAIIGGLDDFICCSCISSIIGGKSNCILSSTSSSIISGQSNRLNGSSNAAIIGGQNNNLSNSNFGVIVGSSGLSMSNVDNAMITNSMKVKEFSRFQPYDNQNISNGDLWFDSTANKFLFQKNGYTYCLDTY